MTKNGAAKLAILPIATWMIFSPAFAATPEVVAYSFSGGSDGREPTAGLVFDTAENLYGTTYDGGAGNFGTVFMLTAPSSIGAPWAKTVLYSFLGGVDGANPRSKLLYVGKNLVGTTVGGGPNNAGTVFQLSPPASTSGYWAETVLYSFSGGADGLGPMSGIVSDTYGNLYGTTSGGGNNNNGTIYKLSPPSSVGGSWTKATLYSFAGSADGNYPVPGLIFNGRGSLFGVTEYGGAYGWGTIFQLSPPSVAGGMWSKTTIYSFSGVNDGIVPAAGLIFDSGDNLYGTTYQGGASNAGTVFRLSPPNSVGGIWTKTTLYSFTGSSGDGAYPYGELIFGGGKLYGTTSSGITSGYGTVFSLTPPSKSSPGWKETVLHAFSAAGDSATPITSLVFSKAGNLYGASRNGGASGAGAIFSLVLTCGNKP